MYYSQGRKERFFFFFFFFFFWYVPHLLGGGYIVFVVDPIGMTLSCLHNFLWTNGWILTKFSWISNWDITKNWIDFCDLDLIFKVTAVEKLKIAWGVWGPGVWTSIFSENTVTACVFCCFFSSWVDEVQEELLHYPRRRRPPLASTFTLKSFKSLYFPDHLIDLVHIWYDDRYSSKGLFSNTPAHYLKVRSRSWTLKVLM